MQQTRRGMREHLMMFCSLTFLGSLSLGFNLLALPLKPLLPARLGTRVGRRGIQLGYALYAWTLRAMGAYRLDLTAIDALRDGPALILAPNHPQLIDALLILSRLPNLTCIMKSSLMRNPFLGAGARLARYIRNDSPIQMIRTAVRQLQDGSILLLFPEGTRTRHAPVNALTASVGVIARHAGVPVQTLLVETDSPYLGKGWPLLRCPAMPITYRVRLGKRFDPPQDAATLVAELQRYFAAELADAPQNVWLGHQPSGSPDAGTAWRT
ncbi:MAG: 1-acyl-sn-glycerol-3-phosphate acyltransferase [Proteobacteria bacterium]|nr:1-acyl-sn-glycerol-3-phosphate acyltransferase [Pseudomonadota bacterium]